MIGTSRVRCKSHARFLEGAVFARRPPYSAQYGFGLSAPSNPKAYTQAKNTSKPCKYTAPPRSAGIQQTKMNNSAIVGRAPGQEPNRAVQPRGEVERDSLEPSELDHEKRDHSGCAS